MGIFGKLTCRLHERSASRRLVKLSQAAVTYADNETTYYMEPGDKTWARFSMFETVRCALIHVYGYDEYCNQLHIHGIDIEENIEENIADDAFRESNICVNISTDRPGFVIGKHGSDIELLEDVLSTTFGKTTIVRIDGVSRFAGTDYVDLY